MNHHIKGLGCQQKNNEEILCCVNYISIKLLLNKNNEDENSLL